MRLVLLVLLLACLFGLAALWQQREIEESRADLAAARSRASGSTEAAGAAGAARLGTDGAARDIGPIPEGWSVLVLGEPSGAEPVAGPASAPQAPDPGRTQPAAPAAPAELPDFELTVRAGDTLSAIAQRRYGTANAELVRALASYNGLASPDALREGQRIKLPAPAKLELRAGSR